MTSGIYESTSKKAPSVGLSLRASSWNLRPSKETDTVLASKLQVHSADQHTVRLRLPTLEG